MKIEDLVDGSALYNMPLLINDVSKRVASSSKEYLHFIFQDSSGNIEANKWEIIPSDIEKYKKGVVVNVTGDVFTYRNANQIKIKTIELNEDKDAILSLLQQAPVDIKILKKKLEVYLNSIQDEDIFKLTKAIIDEYYEKYIVYPAASKNHHNFVAGLLYHSITMADAALSLCQIYKKLDRDMLLAGTLIHDIGKTIELNGCKATEYTLEGKMCGHISIGFAEIRRLALKLGYFAIDEVEPSTLDANSRRKLEIRKEKAILIEHMILSHHGIPEYGSPVTPLTREAFALSMIDDFDAKMQILDKAYKNVIPGERTEKIFSMDDRYFYLPSYSDVEDKVSGLDFDLESK